MTVSPQALRWQKHHGLADDMCLLYAAPETRTHILLICLVVCFLLSLVHEALGHKWQALDLGEFLKAQVNRIGRRRILFWLEFDAMT
jgi:hypothetical protein